MFKYIFRSLLKSGSRFFKTLLNKFKQKKIDLDAISLEKEHYILTYPEPVHSYALEPRLRWNELAFRLGEYYRKKGNLSRALFFYEKISDKSDYKRIVLFDLGEKFWQQGNVDLALFFYKLVPSSSPHAANAYTQLAHYYFYIEKDKEKSSHYLNLLEQIRDPDAALLKQVLLSQEKELTVSDVYQERLKLTKSANMEDNMNNRREDEDNRNTITQPQGPRVRVVSQFYQEVVRIVAEYKRTLGDEPPIFFQPIWFERIEDIRQLEAELTNVRNLGQADDSKLENLCRQIVNRDSTWFFGRRALPNNLHNLLMDVHIRHRIAINSAELFLAEEKIENTRLNAQNTTLTEQISSLRDTNSTLSTEVTRLNAANATSTSEITRLNDVNATLTAEVTRLNDVNATSTAEVTRLNAANATLTAEVTRLNAANEILTAEVARLNDSNATLTADVTRLNAANATLTAEVARLNDSNATLIAEVTRLNDANATLEKTIKTMNENLEAELNNREKKIREDIRAEFEERENKIREEIRAEFEERENKMRAGFEERENKIREEIRAEFEERENKMRAGFEERENKIREEIRAEFEERENKMRAGFEERENKMRAEFEEREKAIESRFNKKIAELTTYIEQLIHRNQVPSLPGTHLVFEPVQAETKKTNQTSLYGNHSSTMFTPILLAENKEINNNSLAMRGEDQSLVTGSQLAAELDVAENAHEEKSINQINLYANNSPTMFNSAPLAESNSSPSATREEDGFLMAPTRTQLNSDPLYTEDDSDVEHDNIDDFPSTPYSPESPRITKRSA